MGMISIEKLLGYNHLANYVELNYFYVHDGLMTIQLFYLNTFIYFRLQNLVHVFENYFNKDESTFYLY